MNDPNGLVFYKGEYHLFYQYNPHGTQWGHMSWGHAVSADMIHWKNLPLAIPEQPEYMIYSGSAAVDWHNSSGLCKGHGERDPSCLIAIYTAAGKDRQRQNLAYSNDRGRSWTNYSGNPVADLKLPDFRDPKVFWYGPQKKWVMVAVTADEKKAVFLDSHDLKSWNTTGSFQAGGSEKGQWECPDLFELSLDGDTAKKKWVLVVNRNPGAPAGGTGVEYFVGQFDGTKFIDHGPAGQELWADYGKDFYATNSFSDIPAKDGRRIWIGWISNWQYANQEPTEVWRGAQSLPRVLSLASTPDGIRLVQRPAQEAKTLRKKELIRLSNVDLAHAQAALEMSNVKGTLLEIEAELAAENTNEIGFVFRKSATEETRLGIKPAANEIFVDRTRSGMTSFSPEFPGRQLATLRRRPTVKLDIFLDRSSLELFVDEGELVMTDRIYPSVASDGLQLYSDGSGARVVSLAVWQLGSIWQ